MNYRLIGLILLLLAGAVAVQAGTAWRVVLRDTLILDSVGGHDPERALADGTIADILWDRNRNGRDDTLGHFQDSLALTPIRSASLTGRDTLSYNSFELNGEAEDNGAGRFYLLTQLIAFGANITELPRPDSFYVRISLPDAYWESEIFSPPGQTTPHTVYLNNWRFVHYIPPPPPIRPVHGFQASDTNYCDGVHLQWHPYSSPNADSLYVYRASNLLVKLPVADTSFVDQTVIPLIRYTYSIRPYRSDLGRYGPATINDGTRGITPANATTFTAHEDSEFQVTLTWNFASVVGVDSIHITRNGTLIHIDAVGAPGVDHHWIYSNPPFERADYCIRGWNRFCGASDSAKCDHDFPPSPVFGFRASDTMFCDGVHLRWNPYAWPEVDSLYLSSNYQHEYTAIPATDTVYVDRAARSDTMNEYYLFARNRDGESSLPSDRAAGMRTALPALIYTVEASDSGCHSVVVTWNYSSHAPADSFLIFKNDTLLAGVRIARSSSGRYEFSTENTDSARFCVQSLDNNCGQGMIRCDVGRIVPGSVPGPINGLTASQDYPNLIRVHWLPSTTDPRDSVKVFRDSVFVGIACSMSLYFEDELAVPNVWHRYFVQPFNRCGDGPRSASVQGIWHTAVPPENPALPNTTQLHASYPNPFNAQTTIAFDLAKNTHVRLAVYDLMGRQIAELMNGEMAIGRYTIPFDASALPSGVYFCRMTAGEYTSQQKLLLMK